MRLIDADALIKDNGLQGMEKGKADWAEYETQMLYEIKDMIDDAPTVDAVPVVRCKDCKYKMTDEILLALAENKDTALFCGKMGGVISGMFYCAFGERMEMTNHANNP